MFHIQQTWNSIPRCLKLFKTFVSPFFIAVSNKPDYAQAPGPTRVSTDVSVRDDIAEDVTF